MKRFITTFILSSVMSIAFGQHQLVKLWQTDTLLKTPESVLYNAANNFLYVSNINGQSGAKDGNGSIGKVGLDGKIINVDWVTGLNAPKGLGLYKGMLWVADIDQVVEINTKTATIEKRIPVEGATFLNDIAVDSKGTVYVSDTRLNKVYSIEDGAAKIFADNVTGANGVFCAGDDIYVLSSGKLVKISKDKSVTTIAEGMESSTDGLEMTGNDFIASCWAGAVYYIKADGSKEKMLDTQAQKVNSADIGFDPAKKIVYVPNFLQNMITAYQLK